MARAVHQYLDSPSRFTLLERRLNRSAALPEPAAPAPPTLAHIPGVVVTGRYRTKVLMLALDGRRTPLARPRLLYIGPRRQAQLVHLGGGRTLFQ